MNENYHLKNYKKWSCELISFIFKKNGKYHLQYDEKFSCIEGFTLPQHYTKY